jgi:hypothetical protein
VSEVVLDLVEVRPNLVLSRAERVGKAPRCRRNILVDAQALNRLRKMVGWIASNEHGFREQVRAWITSDRDVRYVPQRRARDAEHFFHSQSGKSRAVFLAAYAFLGDSRDNALRADENRRTVCVCRIDTEDEVRGHGMR